MIHTANPAPAAPAPAAPAPAAPAAPAAPTVPAPALLYKRSHSPETNVINLFMFSSH
jgi:hypothetical protein